jgi:competence protein ComEC
MQSDPPNSAHPAPGHTAVPLFHAAWLFALGILAVHWLWLRPSLVLLALIAIAVLCCLAALRAQRIAWLSLAALWLLLGAWCALMQPYPSPAPTVAALSNGLLRTVEGTVIDVGPIRAATEQNLDEPSVSSPTQRVDLRVSTIEQVTGASDTQIPASGNVRLTIRWPADPAAQPAIQALRCGDRIRAVVQLLPPETYHDPGVFSRADYLVNLGLTSTASVRFARVERIGSSSATSLACRVSGWQHATTERLLALPIAMRSLPTSLRLSPDDAVMLAAMVAGDRTFLTHSLRVGFERTGSFHMLVVSGFHLAIVAGCLFWIARRLRLPRVPAIFLTIAGSFAYALFTGFATPVQRSFWMVTLYLLSRLLYRERNALNTIGFAALCLLAISPRSLFDASLQMTLLAVLSIAGIAAPLLQTTVHPYLTAARDLRLTVLDIKLPPRLAQFRILLRMTASRLQAAANPFFAWRVFPATIRFLLRLVELLAVSCVVELAMALPMAVYFHRITLFALPVNLLILPLLAILMPAALLMLLVLFVWPAAVVLPAMVVALFLHFGVGLVHLFGSFALGDFRIPTPLLIQSAAFCAFLAASIALARLNLSRPTRWPLYLSCAALLLAALAAIAPRPIDHPRNALFVEAIDVGQGDSILLITPDGKTLLVDGGGFGGGPRQAPQDFDIGEDVVSPTLWSRGIRHLDAVAISHAHSDHIGGLPAVLRNFRPAELWIGNNPRSADYVALLAEAAALHVRVRAFRSGDAFSFGPTRVSVLAPFSNYQPGPVPTNNDSMVLRVSYRATSVLLEGDAESPVEDAMVAQSNLPGHALQSSLLKVGHHGSLTSTRPEFLAAVSPQCAVISCGLRNRYFHPRPEVLRELQSNRVRTLLTEVNGASCFALNGQSVTPDLTCAHP